ncbi:MAG: C25 family cysteine peptidase [Bacteroidales bacterium]
MNRPFLNCLRWPVLFLILFAYLPSHSRDISLDPGGRTLLTIKQNTYETLQLVQELALLNTFNVRTDEGMFVEMNIPGFAFTGETGHPKLPVNRKMIEIPAGAQPVVRYTFSERMVISLEEHGITQRLIPAQPPVPKDGSRVEFVIDQDRYAADEFYGPMPAHVEVLGYMRGLRLARLDIAPVQYNPVTNEILIYRDLSVTIRFEDADIVQTLKDKEKNASPYFQALGRQILNYKPLSGTTRDTITNYPVKYVIVSDPVFQDQLQPFIEWKTKKGFSVIEAYTDNPAVGNTTASIKSYLEDLYINGTPSDPAPSFVLFVGDVGQIPAWSGNAGYHVTDLFYCEYTDDYFPEVYYGRFSAQDTNDLQPQIDKTLQYEKYLMPDPSYLNEVVMVAGMDGSHGHDWGNGQINYGTANYFNAAHGLTSHTYLYPESGSHSADIIQDVSNGVAYGNYTAHCNQSGWGNPSFMVSDIPSLENEDQYGLLVGNCCLSNAFDSDECFGEALLRAGNKGALGYIGGSNSTYWDPDYYWGVGVGTISEDPPSYEETTLGAYDRTFHDHQEPFDDWYTTQDQMIFAGNLAVTQGDPGSAEYYWEIYHLMGDPSLMVYFSEPPELSVSYEPLMPLGTTSFTVTTEPYAYAAISMDGVLYGAALADESGIAVITLDPIQTPGTADVVVTKQNAQPYMGTVVVDNPAGPYMVLEEYVIIDTTAGNGNGIADYGEGIALDVELENMGGSDAHDVSGQLSTTSEYIVITDDYEEWGTVASQSSVMRLSAFTFDVFDSVPDQYAVDFELLIDGDGKETWNASFSVILNAPQFMAGQLIIDDSQGGNDNGRLDAGEEADIIVQVTNEGHSASQEATGSLSTTSAYLTLDNASCPAGIINAGETVDLVFSVTVDDATPMGATAELQFDLGDGIYACSSDYMVVIGQIPVLVVDLDGNHNSAGEMMACFDNLGVEADMESTIPDDLPLYASVFVALGIYSDNHVLMQDEGQDLADYLENGGCLYMEGGDTWFYDDPTPVHPLFHINGTEDGTDDLGTILGLPGTFTEFMEFTYSGDNNWIDHLQAISPGFSIFKNQSPAYFNAVAYEGVDYKTIGSSFEFGGLDDGDDTRDQLMAAYLEFFEVGGLFTGTEENLSMEPELAVYPNPASGNVTLHIASPGMEKAHVFLVNALGQKVLDVLQQEVPPGGLTRELDTGGLPAGFYHCILRTNSEQVTRKLVLTP